MNLLGETVKHKKFGEGMITELLDNRIVVCFAEGQKKFLFPNAFSQYLQLKNNFMQKKVEKLYKEYQQVSMVKEREIERKRELQNKMYTMKTSLKSQVVYNLLEEKSDLEYVVTGYYLSGNKKGKPRIPSNVQPDSAILLTNCENGEEKERSIVGIAMVDDYFWGKECENGKINLHSKYKLILSDENRISLWKYFAMDASPACWGNIPFKYINNKTMQRIIFDICEQATETEQHELLIDLYRYFCSVNCIPESI